eukprot:CAMPEP_0180110302 /NCGR_PEP_ID=MMETSP0985-20121206/34952_1 /TAXON_ID=483367 /ORGANISM="non described non described, Strain CCMP 2436" /LENGTH=86 /DNA_ID=CAMNT_0022048281 /DNA_START=1053 /DNA_END=1310 /DNA_ORIENTATION=+
MPLEATDRSIEMLMPGGGEIESSWLWLGLEGKVCERSRPGSGSSPSGSAGYRNSSLSESLSTEVRAESRAELRAGAVEHSRLRPQE